MNTKSSNSNYSTSWSEPLAGAALFLLWSLELIGGELPGEWHVPTWIHTSVGILFVAGLVLPPIALCIGWIKSFPRWSYPYVVHVLIFSLYMTNVVTPGLNFFGYPIFGREIWGWRAWIPLFVVVLISILITRTIRPLLRFFTNIWQDWTLLTFGMFGILPLLVAIGFDEVDRLYSLYFMVILALLMTSMALFYLRSRHQRYRILALLIGIIPTIIITLVAPTLYWQQNGWVNPQVLIMTGVTVTLVMFSPVGIVLLRRVILIKSAG